MASDEDFLAGPSAKKRRRKDEQREGRPGPARGMRGVVSQYVGARIDDIQASSRLLEGRVFCVVSGDEGMSKEEAERAIAAHGGQFVQNPGAQVNDREDNPIPVVVLVGRGTVRAGNIVRAGHNDVLRLQWLRDTVQGGEVQRALPKYVIHALPATAAAFATVVDPYGDLYEEDATVESLREAMARVDAQKALASLTGDAGDKRLSWRHKYDMEEELDLPRGHAIFRAACAWLGTRVPRSPERAHSARPPALRSPVDSASLGRLSSLDVVGLRVRLYGGRLCSNERDLWQDQGPMQGVTHAIVDDATTLPLLSLTPAWTRRLGPCDPRDVEESAHAHVDAVMSALAAINRGRAHRMHVVRAGWVDASVSAGRTEHERLFGPLLAAPAP